MMKYYTYVLRSQKDQNLYVGMTNDLDRRVRSHNSGRVRSTKGRRPLILIYHEVYETKSEARRRELFLKTGKGREFLYNTFKVMEG